MEMNWLAHLFLSEPTPAFRVGNLLPDFVGVSALAGLPAAFQAGIRVHRQIDAFTDAHPIFRQSVARLRPPFRRFGGPLVDVFYDHFLARDWERYAGLPLTEFAAEFYGSFEGLREAIPPEAMVALERMRADNWLCSYRELAGVEETFRRMSQRLRRPFDLAPAAAALERDYAAFEADFAAFFPELSAYVSRLPLHHPGSS
jgi:acyl carrier protein phosphodiesterase